VSFGWASQFAVPHVQYDGLEEPNVTRFRLQFIEVS
jgi:hypothetical protein